jgi:RNA polymerase sigma-70 factor, ECF subfamily
VEAQLEAGLEVRSEQGSAERLVNEAAFQTFYRSTSRALWAYLYRVLGDAAQAEDVMQDAFLRFLRAPIATLAPDEQRAWIFRVAGNLAIDVHRRRAREARAVAAGAPDAVSEPGVSAGNLDVARSFSELTARERALLWLAYVEGSAHHEIAQALDVKPSSVKVLLFRARRRLMALLAARSTGGRS